MNSLALFSPKKMSFRRSSCIAYFRQIFTSSAAVNLHVIFRLQNYMHRSVELNKLRMSQNPVGQCLYYLVLLLLLLPWPAIDQAWFLYKNSGSFIRFKDVLHIENLNRMD